MKHTDFYIYSPWYIANDGQDAIVTIVHTLSEISRKIPIAEYTIRTVTEPDTNQRYYRFRYHITTLSTVPMDVPLAYNLFRHRACVGICGNRKLIESVHIVPYKPPANPLLLPKPVNAQPLRHVVHGDRPRTPPPPPSPSSADPKRI